MTRRELRENVFMMLFRVEFHEEEELNEQIGLFEEEVEGANNADTVYINHKCNDIIAKLTEIDEAINSSTKGWKTSRMGKVELTILRLAVYEMLFDEDVPATVAINEAVEIAKKFGGDDTPAFVNGILAKVAAI